jgi:hypothetical protein
MVQMETALNVYEAFRARAQAKSAVDFAKNYPEVVELCAEIEKLRDDEETAEV